MSFSKYLERLQRMDQLIKMKATGSARDFADKLEISRSTLMEHIKEMRGMGAPISYCSFRETYYYKSECHLKLGFFKSHVN